MTFCSNCGGRLGERLIEGKPVAACGECNRLFYRNPVPVAACIVEVGSGVVLVKRRNEPGLGLWGLPGGFIDYDEDIEDAAVREVHEETGLQVELTGLLAAISYQEPGKNGLAVFYRARPVGGALQAGDDAELAEVFDPDELPELAFDSHRRALAIWQAARAAFPA